MKILFESKHLAPFLSVSFIALENYIIAKYKGKSSYTKDLIEEANTKQAAKGKDDRVVFHNVDEIGVIQRFSRDALYEDHSDFRFKYLFNSIDNHMTRTVNIILPFMFINSFFAPIFTMRLCELYFFTRGGCYVYENYKLKNNNEGDGESVKINKLLYLSVAGLISVSLLKAVFLPTRSWAINFVEKAKQASTKEMQIAAETAEKTIRK